MSLCVAGGRLRSWLAALLPALLSLLGVLCVQLGDQGDGALAVDIGAVGALLLLLAPGLAAARLIWQDRAWRLVMGSALGVAIAVLLGLGMASVRAPFDRPTVTAIWLALCMLLTAAAARWGRPATGPGRRVWALLGLVAAASLILRLAGAARSELMGDEAKVLLWATDVLQGRHDIILLHRKGPAEILLTALHYGLLGRMTALAGRLPFALGSVVGALSLTLLAHDLLGWRGALIAGLIASVDGFWLGFGHTIQYPNLVLALGIAAVAAAWRLVRMGQQRQTVAVAVLLGALALCHWDALWYAAPVGWLLLRARLDGRIASRPWRRRLAVVVGGALALAAVFYVPYFSQPSASRVHGYLAGRLAGGSFSWRANLADLVSYGLIYNASYYVAAFSAAALAGAVRAIRRTRWSALWQRWLLIIWAALSLGAILALDARTLWPGLALWATLCLGVYVAFGDGELAPKLGLIWLLPPLAGYLFVVRLPLLSIYNLVPGAALLAALAVDAGLAKMRRIGWRRAARGLLAGLYALSAGYALLVFADVDREYIRTYPAARMALYPSPYRRALPANAGVGFAHRAGWEQIGVLYGCGALQGPYWSNEEELITHWYTRGQIRCLSEPRYLFMADNVKDEEPALPDMDNYRRVGRLEGGQASGITIYARRDLAATTRLSCAPDDSPASFVALTRPDLYTARPRVEPLQGAALLLDAVVGGQVRLRGFTLVDPQAEPGDVAEARVFIEVLQPGKPEANLSIQLTRDGETYLQRDWALDCGLLSTSDWYVGNHVTTRCALELSPHLAPGWYHVMLDAYLFDWVEGRLEPQRTPLCSADGTHCVNELAVAKLQVGAPPLPAIEHPLAVRFGDDIWLRGYALARQPGRAGAAWTVTLYWQQEGHTDDNLSVFVHLVDSNGELIAQHDGQPADGANPTSSWARGEWLVDRHTLTLPAELPNGAHQLYVGLYHPETLERLPVDAPHQSDDALRLGAVPCP